MGEEVPHPGNHCTNGTLVLIGSRSPFGPFIQQLHWTPECLPALCYSLGMRRTSPAHDPLPGLYPRAVFQQKQQYICRKMIIAGLSVTTTIKLETTWMFTKAGWFHQLHILAFWLERTSSLPSSTPWHGQPVTLGGGDLFFLFLWFFFGGGLVTVSQGVAAAWRLDKGVCNSDRSQRTVRVNAVVWGAVGRTLQGDG